MLKEIEAVAPTTTSSQEPPPRPSPRPSPRPLMDIPTSTYAATSQAGNVPKVNRPVLPSSGSEIAYGITQTKIRPPSPADNDVIVVKESMNFGPRTSRERSKSGSDRLGTERKSKDRSPSDDEGAVSRWIAARGRRSQSRKRSRSRTPSPNTKWGPARRSPTPGSRRRGATSREPISASTSSPGRRGRRSMSAGRSRLSQPSRSPSPTTKWGPPSPEAPKRPVKTPTTDTPGFTSRDRAQSRWGPMAAEKPPTPEAITGGPAMMRQDRSRSRSRGFDRFDEMGGMQDQRNNMGPEMGRMGYPSTDMRPDMGGMGGARNFMRPDVGGMGDNGNAMRPDMGGMGAMGHNRNDMRPEMNMGGPRNEMGPGMGGMGNTGNDERPQMEARNDTVPRRPETVSRNAPVNSVELATSWAAHLELQNQRQKEMKDMRKNKPGGPAGSIRPVFPITPPATTSLPVFPRTAAVSMPPKRHPPPIPIAPNKNKKIHVNVLSGLTGKMGGKTLKTGIVPKSGKKPNTAANDGDPMSAYMNEVQNYSATKCERSGNPTYRSTR